MDYSYDIVVIGGGPGGYTSAVRASELGAKVCIVERENLGGTCLNRGCIPTKSLYRSAQILSTLQNIQKFGINIDNYSVDIEKIMNRKQEVVDTLKDGIKKLMKANKIEVIYANASFEDKNTLSLNMQDGSFKKVTAKNIIIASGSKTCIPKIQGSLIDGICTSDEMLELKKIPKSLVIVGGGVIGMEFACIFNAFGTKVTVMEFLPRILANVDSDLTKRFTPLLKRRGIDINVSTKVVKFEKTQNGYKVYAENKGKNIDVECEKVLLAIGRLPLIDELNLENAGIEYDKKGICTDENYETNVKGIYAIGDVNGKVMLAHAASFEGEHAAENIMGFKNGASAKACVPSCIFVFPEISSVGITEDEAKSRDIDYTVGKFMFGANGKALTLGETQGMVKVIAENRNGKKIIIGVHIMGAHASDLIHEGALAVSNEMDMKDIINTIHAHPTLSEVFHEASCDTLQRSIHSVPKRR